MANWLLSPVTPWVLVFIAINSLHIEDGGTNAASRFAAMRAVTEQGTLKINSYLDWTIDWSQAPDGNYYSNKAPGTILLGLPAFFVGEFLAKPLERGFRDDYGRRKSPHLLHRYFVAFFIQILPFIFLAYLWAGHLQRLGVSDEALHFGLIAFFLGTTTTIYFNSYFGHALAATMVGYCLYFLATQRFGWTGFFFGLAVLCEYSSALMVLPLFVYLLWVAKHKWRDISIFFAGGIVPAAVFVGYHYSCFGSPFVIALQFQNPIFQDVQEQAGNLWGIAALPKLNVLIELLLGPHRGLLFTQPWVLLGIFCFGYAWRAERGRVIGSFAIASLALLLLANAGFGGWHGGGAPGPRYLSAVLPVFALAIAAYYDAIPKIWQVLLWGCLFVSVVFRALIGVTTIYAEVVPLWPFAINAVVNSQHKVLTMILLVLFVFVFVFACLFVFLQNQYKGLRRNE